MCRLHIMTVLIIAVDGETYSCRGDSRGSTQRGSTRILPAISPERYGYKLSVDRLPLKFQLYMNPCNTTAVTLDNSVA